MKVLLTNFHPGNGGGHTTYLFYLFRELTSINEIDVYIAVPKSSKLYMLCTNINNNNVFDINFPSKVKEIVEVVKNTSKLSKLVKKYNFDILHVNGNPEHKMAMYCKIFHGLNFKIIRTKHDSKPIKDNFFTNFQYKNFMNRMIVVSCYQYEKLNKDYIKKKTTVIHNGIDLNYFKPIEKDKKLLEQYKIFSDDLVFVSVAGTAIHKGWQYLVSAASKLAFRDKIKIIIAGNLPKKEIIDRYVNKLNMQNSVVFTGMKDDVREIISLADIGFVLSTSIETISFACREMMSMSKPVIVSNYAGLPENITNGNDGWIVEPENTELLQKIVEEIFQNENLVNNFSNNSLIKAKNEFGLENFIIETLKVYKNHPIKNSLNE